MIGVFGATGNVGGAVAAALAARGAPFKAIVRDVEAARAKVGAGVELVHGDFADPAGLDRALAGIDTLFIVCGQHPEVGKLETNAIEAAGRTGVKRVVQLSGTEKSLSPDSPSILARQHCAVEATLKASGLDWTLCRPNFFMSNLLAMADPIKGMGKLITALPPATTITMVDPADVGESAAEMLAGEGHSRKTYFLTGAPIRMGDLPGMLTAALGREIEYLQVPPEAARKAMLDKGAPEWLVDHMGALMGLAAQGGMARETDDVETLTGHSPRTLAAWLAAHKGAFTPS